MTKDMTRDSLRTSYDMLELDVYLEFDLEFHLLNHRIPMKQTKRHSRTWISSRERLTKRNSPMPKISPAETTFVTSLGSLYMNKTTPKISIRIENSRVCIAHTKNN